MSQRVHAPSGGAVGRGGGGGRHSVSMLLVVVLLGGAVVVGGSELDSYWNTKKSVAMHWKRITSATTIMNQYLSADWKEKREH